MAVSLIFTSSADETSSFDVCHWLLIPIICVVPALTLQWPALAEKDYLLGVFWFGVFSPSTINHNLVRKMHIIEKYNEQKETLVANVYFLRAM